MTAAPRHANPTTRPDKALDDLYALMNDQTVAMQSRIYAARSASRVEPLGLVGDEPPAVLFLRNILTFRQHGKPYNSSYRQQAATALAYWERRAKQAAIKFAVADNAEQITAWRRILNGCIRFQLVRQHRWPQDKHRLYTANETFTLPPIDPELALNALLLPSDTHQKSRRKIAVDQPDTPHITSETHRREIITTIANIVLSRVANADQAAQ